jgi:hypothetical protein
MPNIDIVPIFVSTAAASEQMAGAPGTAIPPPRHPPP